jgi:hypothetical protein
VIMKVPGVNGRIDGNDTLAAPNDPPLSPTRSTGNLATIRGKFAKSSTHCRRALVPRVH